MFIGNVDDVGCDVALRDLGLGRGKVEPNNLSYCRGKSVMLEIIEYALACGMCGRTSLDSARAMFSWQRQTSPKVRRSHNAKRKMNQRVEKDHDTAWLKKYDRDNWYQSHSLCV